MSHQGQTTIGRIRFGAAAIASTALAAAGIATAIHFRYSADHWRVALVGWTRAAGTADFRKRDP